MQARAEWERVWAPRARDDDRNAAVFEAEHSDLFRAEERPDLFGDRAEYVRLGSFLRDECRDALKSSVFALVAASVGDVAPNAVHHALFRDGRHRPLDQFVGAVLANNPVLERKGRRTSHHATSLLLGALTVGPGGELNRLPR